MSEEKRDILSRYIWCASPARSSNGYSKRSVFYRTRCILIFHSCMKMVFLIVCCRSKKLLGIMTSSGPVTGSIKLTGPILLIAFWCSLKYFSPTPNIAMFQKSLKEIVLVVLNSLLNFNLYLT